MVLAVEAVLLGAVVFVLDIVALVFVDVLVLDTVDVLTEVGLADAEHEPNAVQG